MTAPRGLAGGSARILRPTLRSKVVKTLWKLTAKGYKVVEGAEEDGGVEFPEN